MDRPKNSKVRHGMASCARYGCDRKECRLASLRARKEIEGELKKGVRSTVSSEKCSEHANRLVYAGMSLTDIVTRSGVSSTTVSRIINRKCDSIYRVVEEAIMGISIPEDGWTSVADGWVNATGTQRRLRALSLQGFSTPALVGETRMNWFAISQIRSGAKTRLTISGMRKVTETHERLCDTDPLSMGLRANSVAQARAWARKQGWWPTEAWADIDDPECEPSGAPPKYVILAENYQELVVGQGLTMRNAAERLGETVSVLDMSVRYYRKRGFKLK